MEYNGLFLPERRSRLPWSDLLCQVWGSQQVPSLLRTRKSPCFLIFLIFITIILYILDVCRVGGYNPIPAQVIGPREIPSDLTEITAYHLKHVSVAEYRSWIGLCFNSFGRRPSMSHEWQEGHMAAACGRDCQLGTQICSPFFISTERRLYFLVFLVERWDH